MKHLIMRSLREIRTTKAQFLSIIAIIAIGSAIFSGLFSTITLISGYLGDYYTQYRMADAWIFAKAIDHAEIEAYKIEFPQVELEGRQSFQVDSVMNGSAVTYRFYSLTNINGIKLEEGTSDIKDNEVILDASFADKNMIALGDKIFAKIDGIQFEFEVVGLFNSPEFAYKSKDFSDASSNKRGFGILYATPNTLHTLNQHTELYLQVKDEVESELSDAKVKLEDAYATLVDNQNKLNGEKAKVFADLDNKRSQLSETASTLQQKQNELLKNRNDLYAGIGQVSAGILTLENLLDVNETNFNIALANLEAAYANALIDESTYTSSKGAFTQLGQLYAQRSTLNAQAGELNAGLIQIDDGLLQVNDGLSKIEKGVQTATTEFKVAQRKLDDGFNEYAEGLSEFETKRTDALDKLDVLPDAIFEILVKGDTQDIEAFVAKLKSDDLYAEHLLRADHPAYAMVNNILKPIEVMTTIFPILFFVVASIVILISMTKTIEKERTQIAIFKGLGLPVSSIVLSYMFYGWWAALAGSVPFSILGNYMIPKVLLNIFTTRFSFPTIEIVYYPLFISIAIVLALFFASIAILMALRPILKEIPAQGMRPKPPKSTKRSTLERLPWFWKRLSYTQKLIVRNVLMGKNKILLSSVGVIGSIALLITGLSLQNSAQSMISNSISAYKFQYAIQLDEDVNIRDITFPFEVTRVEGVKTILAKVEGNSANIQLLSAHEQLLELKNESGKTIDLTSDSVIISKILAKLYDYQVGDMIQAKVDDLNYELRITDISNQYLGKNITLSFDHAQRIGLETSTRRYYVSTFSATATDQEQDQLIAMDSIISVDTKAKFEAVANEMLSMLNQIIYIIVASALVLSITVIYNMASINIFERQRELATLRVLGYTILEVGYLVFSENYLLMILGALGGVPAGIFLYQTIAFMVSTPEFMMSDEINPSILLFSVFAGFFFTFVTNRLLNQKIRKIEFVESLKGVE